MPWFRHHSKPYPLAEEERGRQLYTRPRRTPRHPRSEATTEVGPSFTPMTELTPMVAPPSCQYGSTYFGAFTNLIIFTQAPHLAQHIFVSTSMLGFIFGPPSLAYYMPMSSMF